MKTHYYIEIRYFGQAKKNFKQLTKDVDQRFHLPKYKKIPHITVVQPFFSKSEKRVISTFHNICSKYKQNLHFTVSGIGTFPCHVVYAKILPSPNVLKLRKDLMYSLNRFCHIKDFKRPYRPHTTIALRPGLIKFFRIWLYLKRKTDINFTNQVLRITLLKGNKILREYDFTSRKLLNRKQALSRKNAIRSIKNRHRIKKKK